MSTDIETAIGLEAASHLLRRRARGMHPLVSEFFALVARAGVPAYQVSNKAGYGHSVASKWKKGHAPSLTIFSDHLESLGYEIRIVPKQNPHPGIGRVPD